MRAVQVADRVHRLNHGIVNFYLVEDGGKLSLVDAGGTRHWDLLVRTLASIGRSLDDLEAVVLTHAHADHTGVAERARSEAGASVRVHRADAGAATTGAAGKAEAGYGRYLVRLEAYRTLVTLSRAGALTIVPVAEVSSFEDGETIDVPGRPRAVLAPGHTEGSCAILLEERRVLLTGDCLVTRNPFTGRVGPQIMPAGLNRDSAMALRSLDVFSPLPVDVILPGHGEPWTGGVAEAVGRAKAAGRS
jgi:glyoxylase-like metal-dependent hydrolase (beta-lactamase superfamily II)